MTRTGQPVCCAPVGDRCGEGVLWSADDQSIYWTDINRFLIHRYNLSDGSVKSWFFNEPVTAVLLTYKPGTYAVCLGSGVILWEPASDTRLPYIFKLPNWPFVRLNDAAVDPLGSLFVGSMRNNVNADGSSGEAGGKDGILFRIDPAGVVTEYEKNVGISNTLVWSPNHTKFYFGDSLANAIWSYNYNQLTGAISRVGSFFSGYVAGAPDGSAIDEQGYIWNCRYGGSCVVRISPLGEVDHVVDMPTKNITNCTFGGKDMSTLYITTAASTDRLSGSLFKVETEIRGMAENHFRISQNPG